MEQFMISPGPVYLHQSVLEKACSAHHRTGSFRRLIIEIEEMIQEVLGTESPVYVITASGTGVMEAAAANITYPGSRVLVISGGKFGKRWEEIFDVYNCDVERLHFNPGQAYDLESILAKIDETKPDFVALTHVESSTGTLFPLREFTAALSDKHPLLIVDAIASLGVEDIEMDEWGIDVVVSAGQKAFASPAGIGILSLSDRAKTIAAEQTRPLYYFSLPKYEIGRANGDTPFTPAIQLVQMLHYCLSVESVFGWAEIKKRHKMSSKAVVSAYECLNLLELSDYPSSAVQAMIVPEGCDSGEFIKTLAERYNVIMAGGQGGLKGRIIRSGFTGLYSGEFLSSAVERIGKLLGEKGFEVDLNEAAREMRKISDQKDIF